MFAMLFTVNAMAQNLLDGKRIFLDPGHGNLWNNIATIPFNLGDPNGFSEAHANLKRGFELQRLLQEQGAIVGLTRTTNVGDPSLAARRDGANAFNSDVYMSIHSNAHDGMVNNPLVLFHNTNRHADSERFASAVCWWLADNPVTSWNTNPVNRNNVRGQSLGAINTSQMPAILTEDTFHDYRPETHRYLSTTYNDKITFNLYRGILRFFNINPELHPTGVIVGWVKDNTRSIEVGFPANGYRFLPFREGSHDAYWPINGATVELLQNGSVIDTYTVDNNWNGIFGFLEVAPGNYQVRISAVGYITETQDVTVTAGNITAANQILRLCNPEDAGCDVLFPILRLVIGTEAEEPFGTHVTTADVSVTARLYLGIDENNDENDPLWNDPAISRLTSSNRSVATITPNGVITLRTAGTTLIRVIRSTDGATGEITLTVTGVAPITPLEIISYDPQGAQEESARPIVRIEFDRPLNQATIAGAITVTNECGRTMPGVQTYHAVTNGRSVLHFMFNEDLIPEAVYAVTLASGVAGTDGGELADDFTFTFTARPRNITSSVVIDDFNTATLSGNWWQPSQAGQTAGIVPAPATAVASSNLAVSRADHTHSVRMVYQWLEGAATGTIRWHRPVNTPVFEVANQGYVEYYLFGDGTGSVVSMMLQNGQPVGGTFFGYRQNIDWVGWRRITVDILNTPNVNELTPLSNLIANTTHLQSKGFMLYAAPLATRINEQSAIYFSGLRAVQLGNFIERADFTVTFSVVDDENGTLTAANFDNSVAVNSGDEVLQGKVVVFSATPDAGYQVKEWTVNGVVVPDATDNIFTVESLTANVIVTVEFERSPVVPITHTVAFSVVGGNGALTATVDGDAITSGAEVEEGSNIVFTATPNEGFRVKEWTLVGALIADETGTTFTLTNLTENTTVTVEFEAVPPTTHTVTFSVVAGDGTITATVDGDAITSGAEVEEGSNIVFTATPSANYQVKEWTVNGTVVADETSATFTHSNLSANVTVTVEFELSVGVGSIFGANFSIFPNPFTNVLHITGAENSTLQVTNVLGAVVYTRQITGADESINLGELSAGVYFFRLERDGQTKTVTIVKR